MIHANAPEGTVVFELRQKELTESAPLLMHSQTASSSKLQLRTRVCKNARSRYPRVGKQAWLHLAWSVGWEKLREEHNAK